MSMMVSEPGHADADALQRLVADAQRYAGWLAKDHASLAVRASVQHLAAAIGTTTDTSPLIDTLDHDLRRLPSGGIRKMLRQALEEIRTRLATA